jgi:hypothetical protein
VADLLFVIGLEQSDQDNRQSSKKSNKYQLYIYTVVPPDDEPR